MRGPPESGRCSPDRPVDSRLFVFVGQGCRSCRCPSKSAVSPTSPSRPILAGLANGARPPWSWPFSQTDAMPRVVQPENVGLCRGRRSRRRWPAKNKRCQPPTMVPELAITWSPAEIWPVVQTTAVPFVMASQSSRSWPLPVEVASAGKMPSPSRWLPSRGDRQWRRPPDLAIIPRPTAAPLSIDPNHVRCDRLPSKNRRCRPKCQPTQQACRSLAMRWQTGGPWPVFCAPEPPPWPVVSRHKKNVPPCGPFWHRRSPGAGDGQPAPSSVPGIGDWRGPRRSGPFIPDRPPNRYC